MTWSPLESQYRPQIFKIAGRIIILILLALWMFWWQYRSSSGPSGYVTRVMAIVERAGHCNVASDCEAIYAQCPFGCWVTVNRSEIAEVQSLMQNYRTATSAPKCEYMCLPARPVDCIDRRCVMREPEPQLPQPQ